jgi:hypothetical protein
MCSHCGISVIFSGMRSCGHVLRHVCLLTGTLVK